MKSLTTKELISLAGIAIATPLFALAILVSARTVAIAESDISLLALALCGAVISGVTGFGRRTIKADFSTRRYERRQTFVSHS